MTGAAPVRASGRIRLLAILSALLLCAIAIELAANAFYLATRGRFFYTDARETPQAGAATAAEAVFHPYYSFIHRVGRSSDWWTTNNIGFQVVKTLLQQDPQCCDVPVPTRDGEILVGVFGGSVADGFALDAQKSPVFAAQLAKLPAWSGKRVRILNFAMPGFKQPQQVIALAYALTIGQRFDLVLEIDGFNEIVTSQRNWAAGAEPSYPADSLWGEWGRQVESLGSPGQADAADRYLAAYHQTAARDWQRLALDCRSATCYEVAQALAKLSRWRGERLRAGILATTDKQSLFPTARRIPEAPGFEIHRNTAAQWASASRSMQGVAAAAGSAYLQVLQPNQWWRQAAGDYEPIARDHVYQWVIPLINDGYPQLVARLPELRQAGIEVLDATGVFRGRPWREIYLDDCCHYTEAGNALLAEAIVERVRRLPALR
jgi:hypothetical protein